MTWYSRKPEGWSESVWRAYRSLVQSLAAGLVAWLGAVAATQSPALDVLAFACVIPAITAALSAWSNREVGK